uniref:Uncharacterized protein n=1 Tax=Helianthus annuus TaxID=4232 RepID=A0A251U9C4_HELAN
MLHMFQWLDLTGTTEPHSWSIYDYLECFCVPVEVIRQRSRGFDTVKSRGFDTVEGIRHSRGDSTLIIAHLGWVLPMSSHILMSLQNIN